MELKRVKKLKNPFVRVVWEDIPENFTKERIRRVKSYFSKKYNSKNVTVISKAQSVKGKKLELSLGEDVMDKNYQKNLLKEFLKQENINVEWGDISRLDDKVNASLDKTGILQKRYRKLVVNKIKFSNFLSFGDNNVLDFKRLDGITVIDSNPPNFGGKTVLAVDLLLFLFFNNTTKTNKAEEIFNKFRNKNEVIVEGDVEIDGEDYIILRKVVRKKTAKGEWSVRTHLEFFKKMKDGSLQNFTGEQRRETEKFIKEAIGNVDDFLLTILTTGSNLDSLIDAKPTERGNIFYRFIGLELLREKERFCKEMYSTWSKKLISNVYDINTLKTEIEESVELIKEKEESIKVSDKEIKEYEKNIKDFRNEKDNLLESKYNDIDEGVSKIDIKSLKSNLEDYTKKLEEKTKEIEEIEVIEPETYFNPIEYQQKENEKNVIRKEVTILETEVKNFTKIIKQLETSQFCPTCGKSLDDVDHTEDIKNKKKELIETKDVLSKKIIKETNVGNELGELNNLKLQLEIYDRNKLIKEKKTLESDSIKVMLEKNKNSIDSYELNKKKIEYNQEVETKSLKLQSSIDSFTILKDKTIDTKNNHQIILEHNKRVVTENEDKINKIQQEEKIEKIFKTYLMAFGKNGIPKVILRSFVPALNLEVNNLLSVENHFYIDIRINEKHEVEFWMVDKDSELARPLSSASGYEKTISSLALRAVLGKISSLPKPNVTVFDEVFGKVSNDNLEMVGEFFMKLREYFDNILLITHNPLVREWGENVITVKKVDNISII